MDWPPRHVACYHLDLDEPVLFDAGVLGDFYGAGGDPDESLANGIGAVSLDVGDVDHIVVTHPHMDHVGQIPRLVDEADPTVYAPASIQERFERDTKGLAQRVRSNAVAAGIDGDLLQETVNIAVDSLRRNSSLLKPQFVDEWLAAGHVSLGPIDAKAVHAPGHQADHSYFFVDIENEGALISGDMAIESFRPVVLHDGLDDDYREGFDAFYQSLDSLEGLAVDCVYPGHGPSHDRFNEVIVCDRDSLDCRLTAVEDSLSDSHRTGLVVALELTGDRPVRYLLPETMSALAYLVRHDRATVSRENNVLYYDLA